MAKKAQITRSWITYPPHYEPGDGYTQHRFLKDAWNKACSLGEGAECWEKIRKCFRDGSRHISTGKIYITEKK